MLSRANNHIKKYNQLVEVYEPAGLEPIEPVNSRAEESLERRIAETADRREQVTQLTAEDFFDEQRRTEIRETASLPTPAAVADSQRKDMLDRLATIEEALTDSLAEGSGLDTTDDLGF